MKKKLMAILFAGVFMLTSVPVYASSEKTGCLTGSSEITESEESKEKISENQGTGTSTETQEEESASGAELQAIFGKGTDKDIDPTVDAVTIIAAEDPSNEGLNQMALLAAGKPPVSEPEAGTVRENELPKEETALVGVSQNRQTGQAAAFTPSSDPGKAMAKVSAFLVAKTYTGSGDWDSTTDWTGNDSTADNDVIRTNDDVTYVLAYTTALGKDYLYNTVTGAKMYVSYSLPAAKAEAEFNTAAMPWLKDAKLTDNADGTQTLTGYRAIPDGDTGFGVPGAGTVNCIITINQMKDKATLMPAFTAWIDNGDNTTVPGYAVKAGDTATGKALVNVTCGPWIQMSVAAKGNLSNHSWRNVLMAETDPQTKDIYGSTCLYEYTLKLGKENGSIKGAEAIDGTKGVSVDFNIESKIDTQLSAILGIYDIKTYGPETAGALGKADLNTLYSGITTADRGYGTVSSLTGRGITVKAADNGAYVQQTTDSVNSYTMQLSGFTNTVPSTDTDKNIISKGVVFAQQEAIVGLLGLPRGNADPFPDGVYVINSYSNQNVSGVTTGGNTYVNSGFNLEVANASADNGGNVRVYTSNDTLAQKWYIQSNGDGYYRIINVNSGKALDVANAGTDNRANVQQWRSNGSDAQLWSIETPDSTNPNAKVFRNKKSGKVLDIDNADNLGAVRGKNVQQYSYNGSDVQKWVPLSINAGFPNASDAKYIAVITMESGSFVSVSGNADTVTWNITAEDSYPLYGSGPYYQACIPQLTKEIGSHLSTGSQNSTDGKTAYGKSIWVRYFQKMNRYTPSVSLGGTGGIGSSEIYGIWDNNAYDIAALSTGDDEVNIARTATDSTTAETAFMTKADGSLWTSDGEMRSTSFEEADRMVRYFTNVSDIPSGWHICGVRVSLSNINWTDYGSSKSNVIMVNLKARTGADGQKVGSAYAFMLGTKVFSTSGVNLINIDTTSRIYQKTTYDQYGTASNLGSYQEGNTVLITGPEYSIEKTSACTGTQSMTCSTGDGQSRAVFRLQPKADKAFTVPDESATVADDTPAGLILKAVYAGGTYTPDASYGGMGGDEASFTDGKKLTADTDYPIGDFVIGAPGTFRFTESGTGITINFSGFSNAYALPAFYTVYDIDGDNVLNGQTITNTVHIDGDGRPEEAAGKTATASLGIVKLTSMELKKTVDKAEIKNGDTLMWTITLKNNSASKDAYSINDMLPAKDGTNIKGDIQYELRSATVSGDVTGTRTLAYRAGTSGTDTPYTSGTVSAVKSMSAAGTIRGHGTAVWTMVYCITQANPGDILINNATDSNGNGGKVISNDVQTTVRGAPGIPVYKKVSRISNNVGEMHTWTVTSPIPAQLDTENGTFVYTDDIDKEKKRLDYLGNVIVRLTDGDVTVKNADSGGILSKEYTVSDGNTVLTFTEGADYTLTAPDIGTAGGTLTMALTKAGVAKLTAAQSDGSGKLLQMLFDTRINAAAAAGEHIPNGVTLDYSNYGELKREKNPVDPYVFTGGVSVEKKSQTDGTALAGAVFGIFTQSDAGMDPVLEVNGAVITKDKENEGNAYDGKSSSYYQLTSGSDGLVTFNGLKDGTYLIREIKAPKGYLLAAEGISVTVTDGKVSAGNVIFEDSPHLTAAGLAAGGSGDRGFLFWGGAIALCAGGLVFMLRRKKI
ncbi:MAG TPA: RICIN domain-containing protein [Lachnospiraceae bacterium]|nr:RICIN domain-containing protein [Lachnospiraceae bacterium]